MDTATGDIRAVEFASSNKGDSPILPHLLEQIGTVTGGGTFDTMRCHTAMLDRGGSDHSDPQERTPMTGRLLAPSQGAQ